MKEKRQFRPPTSEDVRKIKRLNELPGMAMIWSSTKLAEEFDPNVTALHLNVRSLFKGQFYYKINASNTLLSVILKQRNWNQAEEQLLEQLEKLLNPFETNQLSKDSKIFKGLKDEMIEEIRQALLETRNLSGEELRANSCGACGGPVEIHATACRYCKSVLD